MLPIEHLVEAAIYADDLAQAETFYRDVLGLDVLTKGPGRHVFFRVGNTSTCKRSTTPASAAATCSARRQ